MFFFKNIFFKNFSSQTLRTIIFTFQQLLFVPFFLYFWNNEIYSEWLIISTIPIILAYSELGIGSYASNLIVIAYNKKNKLNVNLIYQNCTTFIIFFFSFILIIFFLTNYLFNIHSSLKIKSVEYLDFNIIILLLILKTFFTVQSSLNLSLLKAIHKYHFVVNFQSIFLVSEILLVILVLFSNGNIFAVALVTTVNYFFSLIVSYIYITKKFSWFNYKLKKFSISYLKEIIYPSVSFMVPGLSKALLIQGTIILISFSTNPNLVIFYNSLRLLLNGIRQIVAIISHSFYPEFTIYFAKKNWAKIKDKFFLLVKISSILTLIITILVMFFAKVPFLIWTNNQVQWNNVFFIIFLCATFVDWINVPINSFPYSINKHVPLNKLHIKALIIYFLFVIILFDFYEIYSIPISLFLSNIFFLIFNCFIVKKIINSNY